MIITCPIIQNHPSWVCFEIFIDDMKIIIIQNIYKIIKIKLWTKLFHILIFNRESRLPRELGTRLFGDNRVMNDEVPDVSILLLEASSCLLPA